ncbi:MAG TPA: SDR family oxidoreductase [Aeromicrobium sp.]|nr:SDR family oxidoreductase [Aeromicrobium sp.]
MSRVPRRIRDSWVLAAMRPPIPPKYQLRRAGDTKVDLAGKRVLLTGASSGIGEAAAEKFARRGAVVAVVARRADRLTELVGRITEAGGTAHAFPCDLSDLDAIDTMAAAVQDEMGGVDIVINNAARSIRRPMAVSLERWHDIDRLMQLNLYGPLRLIRAVAPGMLERGDGHIINVSTWGVFFETAPLFGMYNASKSALAAVGGSMETEWGPRGVHTTTLYYPLVKTDMSAPTKAFERIPGLSPAEAADWMIVAAQTRPIRIAPRVAVAARAVSTVSPAGGLSLLRRSGFQPPRE